MASNALDPVTGAPIFFANEAPDDGVDQTEVAAFAAEVGTRPIGTSAQRNAYPYAREGLMWGDTTDDFEYKHNGTGWVKQHIEDTGWIAPTLAGTWKSSVGQAVEYRRLNGVVYLRGRPYDGAAGTMFTLPVGFRPDQVIVAIVKNGVVPTEAIMSVTVNTSGTVVSDRSSAFPQLSSMAPFIADA